MYLIVNFHITFSLFLSLFPIVSLSLSLSVSFSICLSVSLSLSFPLPHLSSFLSIDYKVSTGCHVCHVMMFISSLSVCLSLSFSLSTHTHLDQDVQSLDNFVLAHSEDEGRVVVDHRAVCSSQNLFFMLHKIWQKLGSS